MATRKKSSSKKRSTSKKTASKKTTSKKRTPPRPKHTANLPAGLAKYWAARGVPK